jgi:hypothetical protein
MHDPTTDSPRWWAKKRAVHEEIWTVATRIEKDEEGRRARHKAWRALYEDSYRGRDVSTDRVVTYNLARKIIQTMGAEVAKAEPRVQAMTIAGDWEKRERSKKLTRFLDGSFREMKLRRKAQAMFKDACTFDGGVLWIYRDRDAEKIKCDRVQPHEILVDSVEGHYGEPRQIFLKRAMHRDVLAAMYPKKAPWIREVKRSERNDIGTRDTGSLVDVIESWHLPSAEGAGDGRHCITIKTATLFDEEWTRQDFPFVFYLLEDPFDGFWCDGLASVLNGVQQELNQHYENIRTAHRRGGHFGIFLDTNSNIDEDEVNNETGHIVKGDRPPQMLQYPVLHPQIYEWTGQLKRDGHELSGASESAAHAEKPAGVISGAAIREVDDKESARHIIELQRYEDVFLEVAEKVIRLAREMFADGVDATVKGNDREFLEAIPWSEVDMDDDTYSLAMFKTSGLPQRPEAKIEKAIEMFEAGILDKDAVADVLGTVPDVDAAFEAEQAPRRNINRMLDAMVRKKKQLQPLPYMNLELAKKLTVNKLNWCDVENVGDDAKERLITFLKQVEDLIGGTMPTEPTPAPMPPMGAPPMDPGMGMPPPGMGMPMDPMAGAPPMPMGDPAARLPPDGLPPMVA